jgi:acyl-homoserine lactone synthase
MIKVFSGKQRHENNALFRQAFRLRHDVFIKQRMWSIPSRLGEEEIDEYDVDRAVYVFDCDNSEKILASVRLTPTDYHSLIADCFPHLIENGQSPRSPHIYEGMRFLTTPGLSREEAAQARFRILYGMVEWCVENHVAWIQAVTDVEFFSTFVDMTIRTTPLGLAHPYAGGRTAPGGGECIAFRWPANHDVLEDLREYAEREFEERAAYLH